MKIIYYHAITTYHLLEFAVHKMLYHSEDCCYLILPEFMIENYPRITELIENGIFEDVLTFRYRKIAHNKATVFEETDHVVKNLLPGILEADEIHVAGAQYYFSNWLIKSRRYFYFWEEASGTMTQHESLERIVANLSQVQYEIALENGMFDGENEYVAARYCNASGQNTQEPGEKTKTFNVVDEMRKLDADSLQCIMDFFRVPKLSCGGKNAAVILSQHFANLDMMSFEEQAALYQTTVDYYLKGKNIIVKSHPDDIMFYDRLIPECTVIREKFPSEFLPFVAREQADIVSAVSSTGIRNIQSAYRQVLSFNVEYEKSYKKNHIYFMILKVLSCIPDVDQCKIFETGTNRKQLLNLIEYGESGFRGQIESYKDDGERTGRKIVIVDNAGDIRADKNVVEIVEEADDETLLCFVNFDRDYRFYDFKNKEVWEDVIPRKIQFFQRKDIEVFEHPVNDTVYFFTKNEDWRREIMAVNYEYELIYTGIKTRVSETTDEDIKIAVLEGILDATERRLLYYLKKEQK